MIYMCAHGVMDGLVDMHLPAEKTGEQKDTQEVLKIGQHRRAVLCFKNRVHRKLKAERDDMCQGKNRWGKDVAEKQGSVE